MSYVYISQLLEKIPKLVNFFGYLKQHVTFWGGLPISRNNR